MREKAPSFVHEECLECRSDRRVIDNHVGPMQHVEQQWFDYFGVLVHAFEVEALERTERKSVGFIVEYTGVLSAFSPLVQAVGQVLPQSVGEHTQGTQIAWKLIQIFDLLIQLL